MALLGIETNESGVVPPPRRPGVEIRISRHIHNTAGLGVDVVLLKRLGVAFIAIGVLEEDAVTAANRPFPIAKGIIGKAKARSGIPPMIGHAALGHSGGDAAVYPSVEGIADDQARGGVHAACAGNVACRIEIPGQIVLFRIGSEEAHA